MADALSGRRVLVVEDEFLVLMLTEDMLGDLGCEPVAAGSVDEALAMLGNQRFDAAMLDMNLDGEEPYAIADALAARGVPFMFATGYVDLEVKHGHHERLLLRKPYQPADLARALTEVLAR